MKKRNVVMAVAGFAAFWGIVALIVYFVWFNTAAVMFDYRVVHDGFWVLNREKLEVVDSAEELNRFIESTIQIVGPRYSEGLANEFAIYTECFFDDNYLVIVSYIGHPSDNAEFRGIRRNGEIIISRIPPIFPRSTVEGSFEFIIEVENSFRPNSFSVELSNRLIR